MRRQDRRGRASVEDGTTTGGSLASCGWMIFWRGFRWSGRFGAPWVSGTTPMVRPRPLPFRCCSGPLWSPELYGQHGRTPRATAVFLPGRSDLPRFDDGTPLAIVDGDCKLCASGARIIARLNREHVFRIGRTQSPNGAALVRD